MAAVLVILAPSAGSYGEVPGVRIMMVGPTTRVIVNASVQEPNLTPEILRSILSLRLRRWSDGSRIHLLVLPDDHDTHLRFCNEHLGTYPYVLRTVWDRAVYSGAAAGPVRVKDGEQALRRVAMIPGALSYVDVADHLSPSGGSAVRP